MRIRNPWRCGGVPPPWPVRAAGRSRPADPWRVRRSPHSGPCGQYPETVAFGLGGQASGGVGHQMQTPLFQGITGLRQIFVHSPHESGQRILGVVRRLGPLGHGRYGHARRGGHGPGRRAAFDPGMGRGGDVRRGSRRLFPRCILPGHGARCALPSCAVAAGACGLLASSLSWGWPLPVWKRERKRIRVLAAALVRLVSSRPLARRVVLSGVMSGRLETSLLPGHGLGRLFHRRAGEGRLRPGARAGTAALAGLRRDEGRFVRGHQTGLAQLAGDLVRADVPAQGADRDDGLHRSGYRFLLRGAGRSTGVPMGMGSPTHSPAWRRLGLT